MARWKLYYALLHMVLASCDSLNEIRSTPDVPIWNTLLKDCQSPSIDCIQKNVYRYLEESLSLQDSVNVTDSIRLIKNNNTVQYSSNNSELDNGQARSSGGSPSDVLKDKVSEFAVTHDLELELPEFLFGGAMVKVSPRSLESNGALLKVEMLPAKIEKKAGEDSAGAPRIFFKKIKKFLGNKLLVAFLAIVLVIKLVTVKFLFFLPMVMGVAAAKKLLLKVILFIFPFVGHLFKLCPYYSPTKFHHHHHQISHLHKVPGGGIHKLPSLHGIELDHPPPGYESFSTGGGDNELGYYSDGPGFNDHRKAYETKSSGGRPNVDDPSLLSGGYYDGLSGQGQQVLPSSQMKVSGGTGHNQPLTPTEIENMVLKAEKEAMLKARLKEEQKRVDTENKRLQEQIKTSLKLQEKLKIQSIVAKQSTKVATAAANHIQQQQQQQQQVHHVVPPQQILHPPPPQYVIQHNMQHQLHQQQLAAANGIQQQQQHQSNHLHGNYLQPHQMQTTAQTQHVLAPGIIAGPVYPSPPQSIPQITHPSPVYQQPLSKIPPEVPYDSFYTPILDKIDRILTGLSFNDEPCRERLLCSMYKNPTKFSPHSNLISAELSRDAHELQKPTSSNGAVIRFYKYVQAARDGQDKRDCIRLYPLCAINTD